MAQAGYTPIQLYYSTTASAAPSSGNLANGELAINITDGKLYYKDNGGTVRVLAGTGGTGVVAGSNTQVQFNNNGVFGASSGLTWDGTNLTASQLRSSGLTSGRVTYASTSGLLVDSANMTFNGTRLTVADLADSGLTATRVVYSTTGGALTDSANLTFDGTNLTLGGGTANGVAYLNGSKVLTTGSALTYDGTTFNVTGAASVTGTDALYLQRPVVPSFAGQGAPAIQWRFYTTGTTYTTGAFIQALADAAWTSTSAPTSLRFYTVPSGSTTPIESMRNDASGMFLDTGTGGGRMTFVPGATRNQILSTTTGFGAYNILRHQASAYEWLNAAGTQVMTLSTGGNAALGTTDTSNGRLNIVAGTSGTGNSLFLTNVDGTYNPYLQFQHNGINGVTLLSSSSYGGTASNFTINIAGTSTATFNGNGNTGLQCVPSAWSGITTLELFNPASAIRGNVYQGAVGGNNVTGLSHNAYWDGSNWKTIYTAATYYASRYEQTSGNHAWYTAGLTNGTITFFQAMTLAGTSSTPQLQLGTTATAINTAGSRAVTNFKGINAYEFNTSTGRGSVQGIEFSYNINTTHIVDITPGDSGVCAMDVRVACYSSAGSGVGNSLFCYGGHVGAFNLTTVFNSNTGNVTVSAAVFSGSKVRITITIANSGQLGGCVLTVTDANQNGVLSTIVKS